MSWKIGFGAEAHAAYAVTAQGSRGRLYREPESPTRTPFQRDRDRIVHSTAFRRLKHKTQVFVYHEGDHFRTRLTHTIEVSQIARSIARALRIDEDLAEALALAHDLGHTPFGHAGEDALGRCMAPHGGFDHNAQSLRIVTDLERRYPTFDGLNLTWETLEGLVKHNGPVADQDGRPAGRYRETGLPFAMKQIAERWDLQLWSHSSAEAQAAAISDDIAYNAHDIDDGLRAGLFTLDDLRAVPLVDAIVSRALVTYPGLEAPRLTNELIRGLITHMVEDVLETAMAEIGRLAPQSADEIRRADNPVVGFSKSMSAKDDEIKSFLFDNMYRHPTVLNVREGAEKVLAELFERFVQAPDEMPPEWQADFEGHDEGARARTVCDYIAGMTDRYALMAHGRLFDDTPDLR